MNTLSTIKDLLVGSDIDSTLKITPFNKDGMKIKVDSPEKIAGIFQELTEFFSNYNVENEDLKICTDIENNQVFISIDE